MSRKSAGETTFSNLAGGIVATKPDGTFVLQGVTPRKSTLYKASFKGKAPVADATGY